jgi:hypothetical protein
MKSLIAVAIAGSLMLSSTAATAAATAQVDPWAALTAMSGGAPAAAMCGSAAASAAAAATAAQPANGCVLPVVDLPPPAPAPPGPPPAPPPGLNPLFLGLAAIAAAAGIYLAFHITNHPNSPA